MRQIFGNKLDKQAGLIVDGSRRKANILESKELLNDNLNDKSGSHDLNVLYLTVELLRRGRFLK
jgi:hypothetical protein